MARSADPRGSVEVRTAKPQEIPILQAIERGANRKYAAAGHDELADDEAIPEEVGLAAIARDDLLVAVDGEIIGWIYFADAADGLVVGQVSVLDKHGRAGVGTRLVDEAIAVARRRGHVAVVLNTQRDVPWNMPWYERLGFEVVPPEHWTDSMAAMASAQSEGGLDWTTRVHMRLRLPAAGDGRDG